MEIINNKITINGTINSDVWNRLISKVENNDDVSIYINDANIEVNNLFIPVAVSALSISSSVFLGAVTIEGLQRGKSISIDKCYQGNIGLVLIKNCDFNAFYLDDIEYHDEYRNKLDSLVLEFEHCVIKNFISYSSDIPIFRDVCFYDKIKLTATKTSDGENIMFFNCSFADYLSIEIKNHHNINLSIRETDNITLQCNSDKIQTTINANNATFSKIDIYNSNLFATKILLFKIEIKEIEIIDSSLKKLDIHTVDDQDAPKRIYSLSIKNSEISHLRLNNRKVVHPLCFPNTTFISPPELHGATIANGSIFPDKEFFKSANGLTDAACYRTLRTFMENHRNREHEGIFFVLEQDSLLNEKNSFTKYFSLRYLYKIFSNYGTNYTKSIASFIITTIVFSLMYAFILSPSISVSLPIDYDLLIRSFLFSLKQSLQPFFILKDISIQGNLDNPIIVILALLNSLISLIAIALTAFAISWKFKRG